MTTTKKMLVTRIKCYIKQQERYLNELKEFQTIARNGRRDRELYDRLVYEKTCNITNLRDIIEET